MRQAIRALGWATNLLWIILLFFATTAMYSAFQIRSGFGQPYTNASNNAIIISIPFFVDNRGFYDITNVNLTTLINDQSGYHISDSSANWSIIHSGNDVSTTQNMSISFDQISGAKLSYLLFNDSNLSMDVTLKLNYARAVPLKIYSNATMLWGAPLANLTIGSMSVSEQNATSASITVRVSFENHSFLELSGIMRMEIVDSMNRVIGNGSINFLPVPRQNRFETTLSILVSGSPADAREARLYFETSAFNYGPLVIPLV